MLSDGAKRKVGELWKRCSNLLDRFTENECRNYFKYRGYHPKLKRSSGLSSLKILVRF